MIARIFNFSDAPIIFWFNPTAITEQILSTFSFHGFFWIQDPADLWRSWCCNRHGDRNRNHRDSVYNFTTAYARVRVSLLRMQWSDHCKDTLVFSSELKLHYQVDISIISIPRESTLNIAMVPTTLLVLLAVSSSSVLGFTTQFKSASTIRGQNSRSNVKMSLIDTASTLLDGSSSLILNFLQNWYSIL